METGKASTGGVTLEELAKYVPMAHEIGERKFDKGANRAVYRLTPPGESILVVYESASGKHYLYDVTQIERGGSTQYSMHWTPPLSGDTIHQLFGNSSEIRGSFTPGEKFAESFQAVIELVKGKANVSTLCHESAHWLKALMEALCEMKDAEGNFLASEQLRGELDSINKWLDRQAYQEKEGTREREIEREEKFARAFEYYIQNGEPPTAEGEGKVFQLFPEH